MYLHTVALEGIRIYAPLPFALPRVVSEGGDAVNGHFLPASVDEKKRGGGAASLPSANFKSPLDFQREGWLGENEKGHLRGGAAVLAWAEGLPWSKVSRRLP